MAVSKHALIDAQGVVQNIILVDDEGAWQPDDGFTIEPVLDAPVAIGWTFDGTAFAAPAPDLAAVKKAALKALGDFRGAAETNFMFNGTPIALNTETQARIANAIQGMKLKLEADPAATPIVEWQIVPGTFATFDLPTLTAIGNAAYDHVQACFANAKQIAQAIAAATTVEELDAIDLNTGW